MALLMLKTQDLTYQDHVINVEVMLAPARAQLLSNKHKTLSSKCDAVKHMFDKEKESALKDFTIEKRMMERKKQAIFKRRSEILLNRVSSQSASPARTHTIPDVASVQLRRGKSAPPKMGNKNNGSISSDRSDIFLTEVRNASQRTDSYCGSSDFKSNETSRRNSVMSDINFPVSSATFSTRESLVRSTTPPYYSGALTASDKFNTSPIDSKAFSKQTKSVRFEDNIHSANRRAQQLQKLQEPPLEDKVKSFLKSQEDFNKKPPIVFRKKNRPYSEPLPVPISKYSCKHDTPLVAKRYTNLTLNTQEIEKAFDNFCEHKNKEELHKLLKLASKLKASVRLARNQSLLPTIAVYRSSKAFKNLLKSKKEDGVSEKE